MYGIANTSSPATRGATDNIVDGIFFKSVSFFIQASNIRTLFTPSEIYSTTRVVSGPV